ncbi:MAG: hypothetical protein CL998_01600 [Euryarchaeota archaeon]|nr:hypothetical protein [Euryarchaeota archaeon]
MGFRKPVRLAGRARKEDHHLTNRSRRAILLPHKPLPIHNQRVVQGVGGEAGKFCGRRPVRGEVPTVLADEVLMSTEMLYRTRAGLALTRRKLAKGA